MKIINLNKAYISKGDAYLKYNKRLHSSPTQDHHFSPIPSFGANNSQQITPRIVRNDNVACTYIIKTLF